MSRGAPEQSAPDTRRDPNVLISIVACSATALLVLTVAAGWHHVEADPGAFVAFLLLTACLQVVNIEVYNRGSHSFVGAGMLALGFTFGTGAAMATAVLMAAVNMVVRRGRMNRGVFDAAQWALAAGLATAFYRATTTEHMTPLLKLGPSVGAAVVFMTVNVGLLCLALSLAEGQGFLELWNERFRWLTPYFVAAGPLGLSLTVAYDKVGITGLLAFTLPPAAMMFSVRQYVTRTRTSVEEVREANEQLRHANAKLAERNEDLQALFQFAGGLAARAHDRDSLTGYAEEALARLAGTTVALSFDEVDTGVGLFSGGKRIAAIHLGEQPGIEAERWGRLRDAILPQLATAIESAGLVEEVRKKHVETIRALARSMEAKDYYTGGHTERVSDIAVALGKRLGYSGVELDAIEIGALLHDIGKIGIPERILHKPGPLDEEEWKVMREHPIISEYILQDVDLHPIVLQVARSSHERIDGQGYPDGKAGEEIPLPARIVLVADAFDALTSDRPYRSARALGAALDELRAHVGTQFCPKVIDALEAVYREQPAVLGAASLRAVGEAA
ncbi:MAG TPA: HD-GYP domain-containing protein [Gaiellaceae bacterium]|nr:HD-GYP domain-containing protein [Gaiellaceae bacterium]